MEKYRISFCAVSRGLSIPRLLEIVVSVFAKATPDRQDDGSVGSRLSTATPDLCTCGVLNPP